jgi:hypothetical protein
MRHNTKILISFLIVIGIILFLMGLVNYVRFGSFTEFGYGDIQSLAAHAGWKGLIGLLLSPGAGLIFYFPPVILFLVASKYLYKENKGLFFLIVYVIFMNWLYFGTLSYSEPISWSGGLAWGPRYLIPVLPFITIAFGTFLTRLKNKNNRLFLKVLIITVCVAGFIINSIGKLVWVYYAFNYSWEREGLVKYSPKHWDPPTWDLYYSPIVQNMKVLTSNYLSQIHPESYVNTSWQYFIPYGLAPCSYDLYIFCKFGITPIFALSADIVILAVLIMKEARIPSPQLLLVHLRNYAKSKINK